MTDIDRQMTAQRRQAGGKKDAPERTTLSMWSLLLAGGVVLALLLGQWMILVAVLGLALLITVHEFGHFLAAKAFGMRVEKFYVGFPPAAVRRTWGETEYGVGIIPLGGFCKISGMTPDEPVSDKAVRELMAAAKAGVVEGTYTDAEIAAADEALAEKTGRIVAKGAESDGAEVAALRRRRAVLEEYRAGRKGGDPVYYDKPVWQRNVAIAAGPVMNLVAAVVILMLFIGIQGVYVAPSMTIQTVEKGSPAAAIGLRAGDTIVGADGTTFKDWTQAQAFLRAHPDGRITLTYRPQGQSGLRRVAVTLTHMQGQPNVGLLGVAPDGVYHRPAPWKAVWLGVTGTKDVLVGTFTGFWWLITGKISATGPNGAVGPVGIVDVSEQAVQQHWYPILLAFLSVNLGIINLIPILPFDGGHIAVNVLEKVRRRRLDTRVLERVVAFGTVLLVMLFIFLTFNDIKRIFGG